VRSTPVRAYAYGVETYLCVTRSHVIRLSARRFGAREFVARLETFARAFGTLDG